MPLALDDVSTTEPPVQNVVDPPAEIDGVVGIGFTVTATGADAVDEHEPLVTITVYEPLVVAV